jgi:hypothetical protein
MPSAAKDSITWNAEEEEEEDGMPSYKDEQNMLD